MRRLALFAFATVTSIAPLSAADKIKLCINPRYLPNNEYRTIEVYDAVCNTPIGSYRLKGSDEKKDIFACVSDVGYATLKYRNVTNNGQWVGSSLMSEGDCISP